MTSRLEFLRQKSGYQTPWSMTPTGRKGLASIAVAGLTKLIHEGSPLLPGRVDTHSEPVTYGSRRLTPEPELRFDQAYTSYIEQVLRMRVTEEDRRLWAIIHEIVRNGIYPYVPTSISIAYEENLDYRKRRFFLDLVFGEWHFQVRHDIEYDLLCYYEPYEYAIELADEAVRQWKARRTPYISHNIQLGED